MSQLYELPEPTAVARVDATAVGVVPDTVMSTVTAVQSPHTSSVAVQVTLCVPDQTSEPFGASTVILQAA